MGIDVSICVSSPLVYSYLTSPLRSRSSYFAPLPPSLLTNQFVLAPLFSLHLFPRRFVFPHVTSTSPPLRLAPAAFIGADV